MAEPSGCAEAGRRRRADQHHQRRLSRGGIRQPPTRWASPRRGAGFTVDRPVPGWYRVLVAPDRPAFVAAKDVTPGGTPTPTGSRSRWQVTPPKLTLQVPTYATAGNTHAGSRATPSDDTRVSDLFIFVRNPDAKIARRKVFYRSNTKSGHPRALSFATDVPLWPGANYVTVHARENEDVQSQETVVIFRKDKIELAGGAKPELKKPAVR